MCGLSITSHLDVSINALINATAYVTANVTNYLTNTEIDVFEIIKNHSKINCSKIAKMIGKSEMTVQRTINKLVNSNLIERIGSSKTRYWKEK